MKFQFEKVGRISRLKSPEENSFFSSLLKFTCCSKVSSPPRVIISWKNGVLSSHLTRLSLKVYKHWIYYTGVLLDLHRVSFGGFANQFGGIWVIPWFTLFNGTLTSHIRLLKFMGNIRLKKLPCCGCETSPLFSARSFNALLLGGGLGILSCSESGSMELPLIGHFPKPSPIIVVIVLQLPPYLLF